MNPPSFSSPRRSLPLTSLPPLPSYRLLPFSLLGSPRPGQPSPPPHAIGSQGGLCSSPRLAPAPAPRLPALALLFHCCWRYVQWEEEGKEGKGKRREEKGREGKDMGRVGRIWDERGEEGGREDSRGEEDKKG
ncbi:unnamed protein product [Closterium sp. NIES-53]